MKLADEVTREAVGSKDMVFLDADGEETGVSSPRLKVRAAFEAQERVRTLREGGLFGAEDNVPLTQWRVGHSHGGSFQTITDNNLLIFVDLYVKADVVFDKTLYRTGEPMVITARLRAGNQPITGVKVTVELARPGESLSTFLATNSQQYDLSQCYKNLWYAPSQWHRSGQQYSGPATASGGADPPHPKLALLQQLLHQKEMDELPILRPPAIFADGTNGAVRRWLARRRHS